MDSHQVRLFRPSDVLFICVGDFSFLLWGGLVAFFLALVGSLPLPVPVWPFVLFALQLVLLGGALLPASFCFICCRFAFFFLLQSGVDVAPEVFVGFARPPVFVWLPLVVASCRGWLGGVL